MTYHWIIVLRFPDGTEIGNEGLATAGPGATRRSLFSEVVATVKQRIGRDAAEAALVLNFVLEPNDLETTDAELGAGSAAIGTES